MVYGCISACDMGVLNRQYLKVQFICDCESFLVRGHGSGLGSALLSYWEYFLSINYNGTPCFEQLKVKDFVRSKSANFVVVGLEPETICSLNIKPDLVSIKSLCLVAYSSSQTVHICYNNSYWWMKMFQRDDALGGLRHSHGNKLQICTNSGHISNRSRVTCLNKARYTSMYCMTIW